jgi:hypothetical protein
MDVADRPREDASFKGICRNETYWVSSGRSAKIQIPVRLRGLSKCDINLGSGVA